MSDPAMSDPALDSAAVALASAELAAQLIELLSSRELTIAVAESLTGGLLVAELIRIPGASAVVLGGVVAYNTELKHSVLGVDAATLSASGPVHPDVAMQMAAGVRNTLAVGGRPADVGIATTGVAGPDSQDGHLPGTAYVGVAIGSDVRAVAVTLIGDRQAIRNGVVYESLVQLRDRLGATGGDGDDGEYSGFDLVTPE